jgi:carboxyl-terminal processing protease
MKQMSRRTRLFAVFASTPLVVLVMVGGLLGTARTATGQQGVEHLKVFYDVLKLTVGAYVEPPDIEKVMDGAMRGLADGLDPMTSYLPPDEVAALESGAPAPQGTLGLTVTKRFWLMIVGVRDGSPAARAGLMTGDFIRAINDSPTRDMSAHTGTALLSGAPGASTKLLVFRANAAEPHVVELTREAPATERASGRRLPGGHGYVRISSFGPGLVDQLRTSLSAAGATGKTGIIIDVRGTADGSPEDGVAAARLFVKTGTLATRTVRQSPPVVTAAAAGDGAFAMPVVLMVSNGTANAAEVFAGALLDNKRATLVGEPTAGLASAQSLVKLPDGHGLLLTTARYVRSDNTPIHTRGLRPDVLVETPLVPFEESPASRQPKAPAADADPVLSKAIEQLP